MGTIELTGIWPYVVYAAICVCFFVKGYVTRVRHNKTTFTIKYFMDGRQFDDSTEYRTYAELCRQMRATGQPLGIAEVLRTARELGYSLTGEMQEFTVGDYHRYTITSSMNGIPHRFMFEIFPASQRSVPVNFKLPAISRRPR